MWAAVLGGGALAFSFLERSAKASMSLPSGGRLPLLGGSEAPPTPQLPAAPAERPPAPTVPPGGAAVAAWNRVADDGAPLFIPDDSEALARILTSEVGSGPAAERVAIGWVARNRARLKGVNVARLVCSPCGKSSGNARPFSTRQPATVQNRELAAMILASPATQDPTQGATSCFEPGLQDRLNGAGRQGHSLDARGVRACWLRSMDYYGSVGRWDLFGPKGGKGARTPPAAWHVEGQAVCCSNDKRAECRGKPPGDSAEV